MTNADGTENQGGTIIHFVKAYLEIGLHKTTQKLLITDLGNKNMMMDFTFLKCHNPGIDWKNGEMKFTRCPESCSTTRACKNIILTQEEADKLEIGQTGIFMG